MYKEQGVSLAGLALSETCVERKSAVACFHWRRFLAGTIQAFVPQSLASTDMVPLSFRARLFGKGYPAIILLYEKKLNCRRSTDVFRIIIKGWFCETQ